MYWNLLFLVIVSNFVFRKRKIFFLKGILFLDFFIKIVVFFEVGKYFVFVFDRCWFIRC